MALSATRRLFDWVRHRLGLDRAIAFTVMARLCNIIGSTGTVLLIVRFLSPVEQGYYYTLLSFVALQTVFELGFSFVILQLAAHERVHLKIHSDARIEGDPTAHARLASVLKKSVRWYSAAAAVMAFTLLPLGSEFFRSHPHSENVHWHGPWVLTVLVATILFQIDPFFSFLEGCGFVPEVAKMRLGQSLISIVAAWAAIMSGNGLFAPAAVIVGYAAVGFVFLVRMRRLLLHLWRYPTRTDGINWRGEIWPFQWRIAISWLCNYFTVQIFTPILFAYRGPVEAGQMGMSVSIVAYLGSLVLPWMTTKAAPFGALVAKGEFSQLDQLFFKTLRQATLFLGAIATACFLGLCLVQLEFPTLARRMLTPRGFSLLLLTSCSSFIVQSLAIYLRSHKSEPLLKQSVAIAVLNCITAFLLIPRWGILGAVGTYFICTGVLGLISASTVFQSQRKLRWRQRVGFAEAQPQN